MGEPPAVGRNVSELAGNRMFLTVEEVGRQLGLKRSRVYELAAAGMLLVVRLGRRMLFPRRGLDQPVDAAIQRMRAEEIGRAHV